STIARSAAGTKVADDSIDGIQLADTITPDAEMRIDSETFDFNFGDGSNNAYFTDDGRMAFEAGDWTTENHPALNLPQHTGVPTVTSSQEGDIFWETDVDKLWVYNGAAWQELGSGTGDFMADGSVAMTGNLNVGGNNIINVGTLGTATSEIGGMYIGDNDRIHLGDDQDSHLYFDGTNARWTNSTGALRLEPSTQITLAGTTEVFNAQFQVSGTGQMSVGTGTFVMNEKQRDYDDSLGAGDSLILFDVGEAGTSGEYFLTMRSNVDAAADTEVLFETDGDLIIDGSLTTGGDVAVSGGELMLTPIASATESAGNIYYDSDVNKLYVYNGTSWVDLTAGGGASTALDNLAAVAINTALLPGVDDTIDLGDGTHEFRDLFIDGTANIDSLVADTADIAASAVPTADLLDITNSGQPTTTGMNWLDITQAVSADAGSDAFNAVNVTLATNADALDGVRGINIQPTGTSSAGTVAALHVNNITTGGANEFALAIGTGWDQDIRLRDTTPTITIGNTGTLTFADDALNSLLSIADAGTTGNLTVSGKVTVSGGQVLYTPVSSATASEGNVYYDSDDDKLYVYNGTSWVDLTSQGTGDITAVGSMTSGDAFADASASGNWLGLGVAAGRIEFDDQATDEVNILDAKLGIGTSTPGAAALDIQKDITASGGVARGIVLDQTLTASADNDILTALYINTSFDSNGHSDVRNNGLIVETGLVGIGAGTPGATLDIYKFDSATLHIRTEAASSYSALSLQTQNATNRWDMRLDDDDGKLKFRTAAGSGDKVVFQQNGNVGIGTADPGSKLALNIAADGTLVDFEVADAVQGNITVAGGVVSYNAFTGSHYGWCDGKPIFKKGELLIASGDNKTIYDREFGKGETLYGVAKSNIPNDKRVIGVYGGETKVGDKTIHLINAVGDGFILVTDKNGDIEVGDYLTSSSHAGYAQKQSDDALRNYTVGKAMQSVDWNKEKVDPEFGFKWKLIACTFKAG
ncbi:MAG: hypothetical protein ABH871_01420, partial [Pseudomonadota bacterium]